ncbi:MAG TPA: iron ABC transporter permease, partial [Chloroflexota bacterium]|nr:iron ABC transporter permease [Chloroflexota bacterium]
LYAVFWLSFLEGLPGTAQAHFTIDNYINVYGDPFAVTALKNTLGFSLTAVVISLLFGTTIAWLTERTDLPGKQAIYTLMTLSLLLPGFFTAMGWLFLLHPRIGILSQAIMKLTGMTDAPLSITTVAGMGWVQGLNLASLGFVLTSASFRSMDPSLEEAAKVNGARPGQIVRRVIVPLMSPGIMAAGMYVFTIALASFDVPAIIGLSNRIYTFSTYVYSRKVSADTLPQYGGIAAMSAMMVLVAIFISYFYGRIIKRADRFQVVTGKGYRPERTRLGKRAILAWVFIGIYVLCAKALPLLLLIWAAGLRFFQAPSLRALSQMSWQNFTAMPLELVAKGATNTGQLMLMVPTLAIIFSFGFSWMVVRSRSRLRVLLDFFAFLPHAVPGLIFGVGAMFVALFILKGIPLYGSVALIAIVYVVQHISFGTRLLNSSLLQIHRDLEEAAVISGASGFRTARKILAPLVKPAILNGWIWLALITYRELTVATLLFTPRNITLPTVVWNVWASGNYGVASAISLVLLSCLMPLILVYYAVGRRGGPPTAAAPAPAKAGS